ncbi:hypothetical protein LUZ63_016987 [Rhynchospora breviuscula]|uniref:Adenylosuccinate lyase n=3 Tax=Mesangiospermae TaxID=1437183 RepID=A0A9Q0C1K9_9POAL|nr:hypothetical protein LUZ63_016987 [Rhynchospora breviuscula]
MNQNLFFELWCARPTFSELLDALEFFHFGCTSEDIHNLAYSLLIKNAMNHVMFPVMTDLCKALYVMGKDNLHMPMPPHIHHQLASPTTLGKKIAICAFRLDNWAQFMTEVSIFGDIAGVIGKCNDQNIVYPEIVWTQIAEELVTSLGLQFNPYATKIGSHHYMLELFDNMLNFNNVLHDFTKDVWSYISVGYFKQMTKGGEVGSSTMPHEVDPTNFGNCRGNLFMAKTALAAASMDVSTYKSDVTKILLPFTSLGLVHSHVAYKKSLHGIKMLQVNESRFYEDLEKNWAVLAETIQTVIRRYAVPEPYETLKELTRDVDKERISFFIRNLDLPEEEKLNLLNLIPHHTAEAENLAKSIDEALVLSEEPVQEAAGSGGETRSRTGWLCPRSNSKSNIKKRTDSRNKKHKGRLEEVDQQDEGEADDRGRGWESASSETERDGGSERQREHPFIVTEPGEVARAKKNGLDYLFHLYEQCRLFLVQVQALARQHGHKPTSAPPSTLGSVKQLSYVTNQVFRYAKKAGGSHINKPKMRHYVHCYALHCLDEEQSNALRKAFKERRQNVGAWRQACYEPLVNISARHNWDIDVVFNSHPRLSIWYVPTKLRQLCHIASSNAGTNVATAGTGTVGTILGSGSGDLLQQPSSIF